MPELNPLLYTARPETETRGTTIGRAREIWPVHIDPVTLAKTAQIAPIERVVGPQLGDAFATNAAYLDPTYDADYRNKQLALLAALERRASGQDPSLAKLNVQENFDRIIASQRGAAAASRGNPALAMRLSAIQGGELQQQASREGVRAALEERYATEQQIASVSAQGREAEFQRSATQAQLEQQAAALTAQAQNERTVQQGELTFRGDLSNQAAENARLSQQAGFDQATNTYNANTENSRSLQQAQLIQDTLRGNQSAVNDRNMQQGNIAGGIQQSTLAANAQKEAAAKAASAAIVSAQIRADVDGYGYSLNALTNAGSSQGNLAAQGENADVNAQNNTNTNNATLAGSIFQGGGAAIASDERAKKDVEPGNDKTKQFLNALEARNFKYKQPHKHGAGEHTGIMAQDMEKSELGREVVVDTAGGKMIDMKRGMMAVFAAQANLNKRINEIEGKKR